MADQLRVVIIQAHVPHYRVSFYEKLRKRCVASGITLEVACSPDCSIAAVPGNLIWGSQLKGKRIGPLILQFLPHWVWTADLVIIPQEIKFISNMLLFLWRKLTRQKIAIWGHGKDFQSFKDDSLKNKLRDFMGRKADWWFAYNEKSASVVKGLGFDSAKITNVRNAIDTDKIREIKRGVSDEQLTDFKESLSIKSDNIAIFTGRFNEVKRTGFLLKACVLIRKQVPDFHMILVGTGPEHYLVDDMARQHTWIHAVGAKDDTENIPYWLISKLLLMPGAVGLVVLDSFVFGVPMVVISGVKHGPEISYFKSDVHGIEVEAVTPQAYADSVVALMSDREKLECLRSNCLMESQKFSLDEMVSRYTEGIVGCLRV